MPEKASEEQIFGIIEILKAKGNTAAVSAILDAQEVLVDFDRYDNWNGGLYNVSIIVKMDHYGYGCLKSEDLIRLKEAIGEAAEPVLDLGQNDTFTGVTIRPAAAVKLGWREDTAAWLRGSGVTNQGRVRSDNVAAKEFDGLLFRSQPEINLYKALKSKGLTFAPLPVFIRGGDSYRRLEPDFIVIMKGLVFHVEVDGDSHHRETPVVAQARVLLMEHEGVLVRRFSAEELDSDDKAKAAVDRLIAWMEQQKRNR